MQWRLVALAGATVGLGLAPFASLANPRLGLLLVPASAALVAARPRSGVSRGASARGGVAAAALWLALVALTGCGGGLAVGGARLRAIDAGAFDRLADRPVTATGFVTAVPRRSDGTVSVRVQTADGRLLIEAPEPIPDLPIGREVRASGTLREPDDWEIGYLRTHG
ncbi:MAG TPA: hypothetical protein VEK39_14550, partial [Solirubrobacterales bacterium]|nr:hypothetical protein [Solirubrobacterales bacterium]